MNCSHTNISSLSELGIPNETMWLVVRSNHMPHLDWSVNLSNIEHLDLENSSIRMINDDFFTKMKTTRKTKFLNLANNDLKWLPKTLKGTNFSEVYLSGNPIDCNCDMLWVTEWLNTTHMRQIVKDYDHVLCFGGEWNGIQVYELSAVRMGCYPKNIPK